MSIQNGQPLIEATRSETSGTSPFGNWPDCSIEAPSSLAARRIGGQCAMIFVVFSTSPNISRSLANRSFRIGSPPSSSISRTRGMFASASIQRTAGPRSLSTWPACRRDAGAPTTRLPAVAHEAAGAGAGLLAVLEGRYAGDLRRVLAFCALHDERPAGRPTVPEPPPG